jgi:hypothetical protein
MRMSFLNIFSKPETGPSRGASIMLRCSNLSPSNYARATSAIEKTGIKGVMEITSDGKIALDLEGPHTTIEKLLSDTQYSLFGCPCESELVWKPFANKYSMFIARPYMVVKAPPSDKNKP